MPYSENDPRSYLTDVPDMASMGKSKIQKLKDMMNDESGLGTVTGVGLLATLALLASKVKDQKLIAKAIKNKVPINRNVVKPVLAGLLGGSTGWTGKHFYDEYNKGNGIDWR
jgi:hypothetical protein